MVFITETPIIPASAYELISTVKSGSAVFHYAIVKADTGCDRTTTGINFRQNGDMSAEMEAIAAGLMKNFSLEDILLVRRTGNLAVGEIISLVAASSPNSSDAFEACKTGISQLKQMITVKKEEIFQ
jgi:molybdopterin synthase catalytic subunit